MATFSRGRLGGLVITGWAVFGLYACTSDDDAGGSGGFNGADSGFESGPTGSSGGTEGGPLDDGGADGGVEGGGIKAPLASCSPLVAIDATNDVSAFGINAGSFNGKYLFTWTSITSNNMRGRYFDGTKFDDEIAFGPGYAQVDSLTVDPMGKAYFIWQAPAGQPDLGVIDMMTGSLGATASIPFANLAPYIVNALPAGGALAIYQTTAPEAVNIAHYLPGGSLTAAADAGEGVYPTTFESGYDGFALNAAGKGAAYWTVVRSGGGTDFTVTPFDGTTLGTPITRTFPGTPVTLISAAALANGDIAFSWRNSTGVAFSTFHVGVAAGTEWDADMQLTTIAVLDGGPILFVGAGDAVTIMWTEGSPAGTMKLKRRLGGVWSDTVTPCASNSPLVAAIDPGGNVVFGALSAGGEVSIGRIPADSTAVPPLVKVGLGAGNAAAIAIAFDSAGDPVVGGLQYVPGPPITNRFSVTTCTASP